ncbi:hypothetical protein Fmac_005050 [Flemingia macrophylla]|uniref:Uncharacterized protein n=1 Tax=Flemingia macrophylla TaxID=520843 RepID=A0ABD1N6R1_9FABA
MDDMRQKNAKRKGQLRKENEEIRQTVETLRRALEVTPAKSTPMKFHDHRNFHHWKYAMAPEPALRRQNHLSLGTGAPVRDPGRGSSDFGPILDLYLYLQASKAQLVFQNSPGVPCH